MNLKIATFNVENLDLDEGFEDRFSVLNLQLERIGADILALQEINSQDSEFKALDRLISGTQYENYFKATTLNQESNPYSERNLVMLSRFEINSIKQYKHVFTPPPKYKKVTALDSILDDITWERPLLHIEVNLPGIDDPVHIINLHLKSRIPSNIEGQKKDRFSWKSASGWAEGFWVSSMRRVGQALETRVLVDKIFDDQPNANIVVLGDFNAEINEVPLEAIVGRTENTGNSELNTRVLVPCEFTVPETSRYTLIHHGKGRMLDHILVSRNLLRHYVDTEIHNELLADESVAFATDVKFPTSDHAPVIANFIIK